MTLHGRRRPDTMVGDLPPDIQAGDFWRVIDTDGQPRKSAHPGNLTGGVWYVVAPVNDHGGFAIGRLEAHTVREHEDGSISVAPGDGSSNSIGLTAGNAGSFHGYIDHGRWYSA